MKTLKTAAAPKSATFATKLPEDLMATLDDVCTRLGLKKSALVEAALREKLEDVLDANDLREAIEQETRFHPWEEVREQLRKKLARRATTKSKSGTARVAS